MKECEATCAPWFGYRSSEKRVVRIIQDCSHQAAVRIDGINLCLKHAGTIAVRKLLNEGSAEIIDKNNKFCGVGKF